MAEMTPEDLTRVRDAVRRRDRCADAAIARCRYCGIPPLSGSQARTAYDAMLPLIAAAVRAQVAEDLRNTCVAGARPPWAVGGRRLTAREVAEWAAQVAEGGQHSGEVPQ